MNKEGLENNQMNEGAINAQSTSSVLEQTNNEVISALPTEPTQMAQPTQMVQQNEVQSLEQVAPIQDQSNMVNQAVTPDSSGQVLSAPSVEPTMQTLESPTTLPSQMEAENLNVVNETPMTPNTPVNQLNVNTPAPMPNEMMGLTQSEPSFNDFGKPKKSKGLLIGIVLVIIIAALGVGAFFYLKNNNKQLIVAKSFEKLQAAFTFNEKNQFDFALPKLDEYLQSANVTFSGDSSNAEAKTMLEMLKDYNFLYNLEKRANAVYMDFDFKNNNESILSAQMLGQNNKLYLFVEKIFSKVLEFDYNTDILVKDEYVTIDDYLYLYDLILEKLVKNIDDSAFTKDSATIKIDGKDVKVNKILMSLNQDQIVELLNKVLADLKADTKANGILKKLYEDFDKLTFTKEDIMEGLVLNYSVYTTGLLNDVLGIDFEILFSEGEKALVSYRAEKADTFYIGDGTQTIKIEFKKAKNNIDIILYDPANKETFKVNIKCPDAYKLNITGTINIDNELINFGYNVSISEVTKNKEYKIDMLFNLAMDIDGIDMALEMKADINLKDVSKETFAPKLDISSAINYNSLTDEQLDEITNNVIYLLMGDILNQTNENTYCAQAYTCSEPIDGISECKYLDENMEEQIVECEAY